MVDGGWWIVDGEKQTNRAAKIGTEGANNLRSLIGWSRRPGHPAVSSFTMRFSGLSGSLGFCGVASYCAQNRGSGNHTMVIIQRDNGESNEIQNASCCRPRSSVRAHPVVTGNGTEHHTIQHHNNTEPTSRADAEHHHYEH